MHPFKLRLYMLMKLPAAFFSGVRVPYADETKAIVTVPYRWFTRNPFGSTYFACLSMAAEMSTGILCMVHTYESKPAVKMLVVKTEGTFLKKAKAKTTFTCEEGKLIADCVRETTASGKSQQITCRAIGKDAQGETISEFSITWSFKTSNT